MTRAQAAYCAICHRSGASRWLSDLGVDRLCETCARSWVMRGIVAWVKRVGR